MWCASSASVIWKKKVDGEENEKEAGHLGERKRQKETKAEKILKKEHN